MTPDTVFELQQTLLGFTDVLVNALERRRNPREDDMTTRGAYEAFGRRWVTRQVRLGRIRPHRVGEYKQSPVVFSRTELLALKRAEGMARCEIATRERKTTTLKKG